MSIQSISIGDDQSSHPIFLITARVVANTASILIL